MLLLLLLSSCTSPTKVIINDLGDLRKEDNCWQQSVRTYGQQNPQEIISTIDKAIGRYKILVEKSLTYRANALILTERLQKTMATHGPISGHDLDELNQGMVAVINLRRELFVIAYSHACWPASTASSFSKIGMEPISAQTQLKGIMLSLSASLLLYDNYLLMISLFSADTQLRRFLNASDSGYSIDNNELLKCTKTYNSHYNRKLVKNAISFYEKTIGQMPLSFFNDNNNTYLQMLIENSPSYRQIKLQPQLFLNGQDLQFMYLATTDSLHGLSEKSFDLLSKFFGNSVGLVATRKGKLFRNKQVITKLRANLKTGDILLEKTPFRLTDKLIPGHWGHAAIWIGTAQELKDLGIWNHPLIKQFHAEIDSGHSIVEALRSGVELNTLGQFINVDDIAVIRNNSLTKEKLKERIILAFRQIGKKYDFNFDVETTDKIVCSELIYTVFLDMKWPTESALGRHTISPNNIATQTITNGPLDLIVMYHNGQFVENDHQELMKRLLNHY